jgi:hypothetical protein
MMPGGIPSYRSGGLVHRMAATSATSVTAVTTANLLPSSALPGGRLVSPPGYWLPSMVSLT